MKSYIGRYSISVRQELFGDCKYIGSIYIKSGINRRTGQQAWALMQYEHFNTELEVTEWFCEKLQMLENA